MTLLFAATTSGQQRYIDSLKERLQQSGVTDYEKTVLRCKLSRAYFETDLPYALTLAGDSGQASGPDAKAWIYATRIQLLVQQKNKPAAYAALDSAMLYESKATDPIAKGMVWYRNGWLDLVDNEEDMAVSKFLKALDYFRMAKADGYAALTYHYLASIYSYGSDEKRQADYAEKCYTAALNNGEPDVLNTAYYTMGQHFYDQYKLHNQQRLLLDSALYYYNKSIQISDRESGRVLVRSNTAAVALNIANIYFQHFPPTYKDSVYGYLDKAEAIATSTGLTEILINCYGMRSEYVLQSGHPEEAEQILLAAIHQTEISPVKMPRSQSRIYRMLARVAEQRNDTKGALAYLKSYVTSNEEAVNQERIANTQRIDARYRSAQQEQKIQLLEQEAAFTQRRNILYIGLGVAIVAALAFLLISYNYRLKASMRKQALVDKEKEEVVLKVKLKEAETNQLLAEQTLMRERQERLEKELLAEQLQKQEKSQLIEMLSDKNTSGNDQLKKLIKQQQRLDEEYEGHKTDFVEVHSTFFERLRQRSGDSLTRLDMKYCSYILMGLSTKEISTRLGIEPKSIRMARYRIKQKLGLGKDDNLDNLIMSLG
ncbi:LuxR C-terminal-related transcriptional regulator [Filimonas effusa]|uniref:LuxR C-terminal-related transcriptional regulator n=1 Tax=Filimonas effusa TaxID=2508721 RepID=UPI001C7064C9|nr:LuxR C-terminal-related transcriptional regulator [Filimonas effusa]